jgi:hypothetical protein
MARVIVIVSGRRLGAVCGANRVEAIKNAETLLRHTTEGKRVSYKSATTRRR